MADPIGHLIEAIELIAAEVLSDPGNVVQLIANDLFAAACAAEGD